MDASPPALHNDDDAMRLLPSLSLVAGLLIIGACSSASQPPVDGECISDAGCGSHGGGGGGGGGGSGAEAGEDAASSCAVSASQSQCDQCIATDCCTDLDACTSSATCDNLISCVDDCATEACETACEKQYPGATSATYQQLVQCSTTRCPVCEELGVGDPCSTGGVACNAGLTCTGLWCTRTCAKSSDCTGLGAYGGNFTGSASVCRHVSTGDFCFPGCSSDTDCADFPGTYCLQTTALDGSSVLVCATGPDAGLE